MSAVARKLEPKPRLKTFHAGLLVTRLEQWWVEAETVEEAQALLASGQGHHAALGERVVSSWKACSTAPADRSAADRTVTPSFVRSGPVP